MVGLATTPVNFVVTYLLINLIKYPKVMYRLYVFVSVGSAPTTDGYAFPDNIQLSSDPMNTFFRPSACAKSVSVSTSESYNL